MKAEGCRFGSLRWHSVLWCAPLLAATIVLTLPVEAQRGSSRLTGNVTDADGNPLAGVGVVARNDHFTPGTVTATSDDDGHWAMLGFGATSAEWAFTFQLEGYAELHLVRRVEIGKNDDLDAVLEHATPGADRQSAAAAAARNADAAAAGAVAQQQDYFDGKAAYEAGDYAAAVSGWEAFLTANPELVPVWLRVADANSRMDNAAGARAAYERVLEFEPDQSDALFGLGMLSANAGDADTALGYFERIQDADPDDPSLFYNIAELYFQRGQAADAIVFYERALEIDPQYLAAYKQLGFAAVNSGQMDKAIAAFERFLDLAPEDTDDAALIRDILGALRDGHSSPW